MTENIKKYLIEVAKNNISDKDPSHDIYHAYNVLKSVEYIAKKEGGDLDILIPAALFHDVICYQKNDPKSKFSAEESAKFAQELLNNLDDYPKEKIEKVYRCINECSFSKGIVPDFLESKILQDADKLEATGIISIMRTYCSGGQMSKKLYNYEDPFCENREPNCSDYSLDLFYERLIKVKDMMHTEAARKIAIRRTEALQNFLNDFKKEVFDDFEINE